MLKKRDKIKKEMLYNRKWILLYIDDRGAFDFDLINRSFKWLSTNIDRRIQQIEAQKIIHIDDIS